MLQLCIIMKEGVGILSVYCLYIVIAIMHLLPLTQFIFYSTQSCRTGFRNMR